MMLNINLKDMYNGEAKLRYLESFEEEQTAYITSFIFKSTKKTETALNKDIYDMNKFELEEVIKALSASTVNSAYTKSVQLEMYIDWAIENGYVESNINPLTNINKKEWVEPFVATYKQQVFTRKDILNLCDDLYNVADKAILLCVFEGIAGEGYSEMLNLRTEDLKEIDDKFYATLTNKNESTRTIEISKELFEFLHQADQEIYYYNKNGEATGERYQRSEYVESEYIFKKTTRGKQTEDKLDYAFFIRKFQVFKKVFDMPFLRSGHVEQSGMMHLANEIYQRDGELNRDNLYEIYVQFNEPKKSGERTDSAVFAIKKLVGSETFEKLYGYKAI